MPLNPSQRGADDMFDRDDTFDEAFEDLAQDAMLGSLAIRTSEATAGLINFSITGLAAERIQKLPKRPSRISSPVPNRDDVLGFMSRMLERPIARRSHRRWEQRSVRLSLWKFDPDYLSDRTSIPAWLYDYPPRVMGQVESYALYDATGSPLEAFAWGDTRAEVVKELRTQHFNLVRSGRFAIDVKGPSALLATAEDDVPSAKVSRD